MQAATQFINKIPDQVGFVVLKEDGSIIATGGELMNNERFGRRIHAILKVASATTIANDNWRRMTIHYETHAYVVAVCNKQIIVVKRRCST